MKHQLHVTWQHMRRSPYQAAAAVMIMTLTAFVGIVFLLLSLGSQQLLVYLEQKPQVIAFFNDTISTQDQVQDTVAKLQEVDKSAIIIFVSKDQALKIYQDRNKGDPLLLELVSANTLPASLEVSAKSVSELPALYEVLKAAPNVEDISYQKDVVNTLISVLDKIRKGGVALVSFLTVTSLFTILTIIGMKIALRREEVEVERLVGATGGFISLPFILEGFFYGLIGAVISWTIVYGAILIITPKVLPYLGGIPILPIPPVFMFGLLGLVVLVNSLVGITGSVIAVWRYLKN